MIGIKVKRGKRTGVITQYTPGYNGCISVTWDDNKQVEGWFDKNGSDGTADKENHIQILNKKP